MKATNLLLLAALMFSGCDKKNPSEAASTVETKSVADARSDEAMLRAAISKGLEVQLNAIIIPVGDIEITSGFSSQMEPNDYQHKHFRTDFVEYLKSWQTNGLATFSAKQESGLAAMDHAGSVRVTVTPTDKAQQLRDEELSTTNYIVLHTASCEVLQIIRSAPYKSPLFPGSEEYRLVLGTYRVKPLAWYRAVEPKSSDAENKFRAVMQLNPFTKRYTFKRADYGDPQSDGWETHNIE
jgi:hypothetical protein